MRQHICQGLYVITNNRWQPWYPSTEAFLVACNTEQDPLHIRYSENIYPRSPLLTLNPGKVFT